MDIIVYVHVQLYIISIQHFYEKIEETTEFFIFGKYIYRCLQQDRIWHKVFFIEGIWEKW